MSLIDRDKKACIETTQGVYKGYFTRAYLDLSIPCHTIVAFDKLFGISYEDYKDKPLERIPIIGSKVGMEVSQGCCPECDDPQELIRRYYNLYKTNNISIE